MSPPLSPRRRQSLLPARDGFICRYRPRSPVPHRFELLVVADSAGGDDGEPPRVQEPLKLSVAGRIVRSIHSLVVLLEELTAFLLRQIPENRLGVIRILVLNRLSGHVAKPTPRISAAPERQVRGDPWLGGEQA